MPKILIVDDEKLARSDVLFKVSRSGFQFDWIMEASSAEEAYEIIRENQPDILLTDIIMDGNTGIDLIRQASQLRPEMVSIIICGHPNFTFAHEAIALNVIGYILKPVRQEQLSGVLSKAIVEILRRKNLLHLSIRNNVLEQKVSTQRLQENLFAFLNGAPCDADFSVAPLFCNVVQYYQICLLRISLRQNRRERFTESDYGLLRYGIQNIIKELGKDNFLTFDSFGETRQITILAGACEKDPAEAYPKLRHILESIHQAITRNLGVSIHMGVSLPEASLSGKQLLQAKQALDLRLCMEPAPMGSIYFYGDYNSCTSTALPENELKLYQKFLDAADLQNALKTVRRILNTSDGNPALYLRMAYVEMVCVLSRTCFKKGVSIFAFLGSECISGTVIERFETKAEMVENLCDIVSMALRQWVGDTADIVTVLNNIKASIESNFTNSELCTNLLSSQFCISLGYLSAMYKKTFGIPISKYIISLRMEYAARLLKTTDLPIVSISESCGFNNLSYFMRVFRKYYSVTPTEYRKAIDL